MRTSCFLAGLSSALLIGSVASAQPAGPAQGQGGDAATTPAGPGAASFSDQQLRAFATVTVELQQMQAPGAASDPAAMAAAVQKSGLSVDQYNQIAAQMRSDPAFNARVQELAQTSGAEAGPARPTAGASTSPSSGSAAPDASTSGGAPGRDPVDQGVAGQGPAGQHPLGPSGKATGGSASGQGGAAR